VSILNAFGRGSHLDDDALAELWSARLATGTDDYPAVAPTHLRECGDCRLRYDAYGSWLDDLRTDATSEADAYFPAERLAAQQQQIFRRLEALERPARVIAFPRQSRPTAMARRGPQRWIAAAAAAGLIIGLGAGEVLNLRNMTRAPSPTLRQPEAAISQTARGGLQAVGFTADDAFLYDSDAASPRVEALQALDELTPRVRDLDPSR
jgi:hypothetical protein